jgi:hypothetical protein
MAVDGTSATRWSSGQWMQPTDTGWIYVDLGAPYDLSEVRINWEAAYAADFQVQLSNDALNWVAVKAVAGNAAAGVEDLSGLSGQGRYVRIYCTRTSTGSDNYSIRDLQVFGTPVMPTSLQPAGSLTVLAAPSGLPSPAAAATPEQPPPSAPLAASFPPGASPAITQLAGVHHKVCRAAAPHRVTHPLRVRLTRRIYHSST